LIEEDGPNSAEQRRSSTAEHDDVRAKKDPASPTDEAIVRVLLLLLPLPIIQVNTCIVTAGGLSLRVCSHCVGGVEWSGVDLS